MVEENRLIGCGSRTPATAIGRFRALGARAGGLGVPCDDEQRRQSRRNIVRVTDTKVLQVEFVEFARAGQRDDADAQRRRVKFVISHTRASSTTRASKRDTWLTS